MLRKGEILSVCTWSLQSVHCSLPDWRVCM